MSVSNRHNCETSSDLVKRLALVKVALLDDDEASWVAASAAVDDAMSTIERLTAARDEARNAAFDKAMGMIGVDMSYLRTVGAGNTYTSEQVISSLHSIRQSIMRAKLKSANPEMGAEDLTDAVNAAVTKGPSNG